MLPSQRELYLVLLMLVWSDSNVSKNVSFASDHIGQDF